MEWSREWNDLQKISKILEKTKMLSVNQRKIIYQKIKSQSDLLFMSEFGKIFFNEYPSFFEKDGEKLRSDMSKDTKEILKIIKFGYEKQKGDWDKLYWALVENMQQLNLNSPLGTAFFEIYDEKLQLEKNAQYKNMQSDFKNIELLCKKTNFSDKEKCKKIAGALGEKNIFKSCIGREYLRWMTSEYTKENGERVSIAKMMVKIAICICMLAMVGSFSIWGYLKYTDKKCTEEIKEQRNQQMLSSNRHNRTMEKIRESSTETSVEQPVTEETEIVNRSNKILKRYKKISGKYQDFFGWIKIPDTSIDYPVMQSEVDGFYLHHDFRGNPSQEGAIFVDKNVTDVPKDNLIVLYGHNMKNGNIFGELRAYKKYDFAIKHSKINFDTKYEKANYEVVSVLKTRILYQDEEGYRYYQTFGYENEEDFLAFQQFVKENQLFSIGKTLKFGDEVLLLSTCDYSQENGRFVVVARKLETKK